MKKLLSVLVVAFIALMFTSCVDEAYEEMEIDTIQIEKSDTDDDDIPPNPPGGCGSCGQTTN